jgi:hypothetical protein
MLFSAAYKPGHLIIDISKLIAVDTGGWVEYQEAR